jgi:hypothetical protein
LAHVGLKRSYLRGGERVLLRAKGSGAADIDHIRAIFLQGGEDFLPERGKTGGHRRTC